MVAHAKVFAAVAVESVVAVAGAGFVDSDNGCNCCCCLVQEPQTDPAESIEPSLRMNFIDELISGIFVNSHEGGFKNPENLYFPFQNLRL